jgi:hypothetical protein
MPLEFDDSRVDVGGVDDRRGVGGGMAIGGGAGVVGLIVYLLFSVLGGGDGGGTGGALQLPSGNGGQIQGQNGAESAPELQARCNTEGALDRYTDCRLIKVYNIADDVWSAEFERRGLPYERPRFAFFSGSTRTGCGAASADVGPFYCPPDREIYFELTFLEQLQEQFGAEGEFAQAYIAAHEFGHHLQTILGTEPKVRAAQQRNPAQANRYSVALELQADCYAGVWAKLADQAGENGINLTQQNIAEAVNAAGAVGDDRIQRKVQGRVNPEKFTHGTAEQRQQWFSRGYASADMDSCNTFSGA